MDFMATVFIGVFFLSNLSNNCFSHGCGGAAAMEAAAVTREAYFLCPCFLGHMRTVCFWCLLF